MKNKILHIVPTLKQGGAEKFVVNLCNQLAENESFDVTILTLSHFEHKGSFINEISDKVSYVAFNKGSGLDLKIMLNLTKFIIKNKITTVHTHLNALEYVMFFVLYRIKNIRFFHTIHSEASKDIGFKWLKYYRLLCFRSNTVIPITISESGRKTFRELYRLKNDIMIVNGTAPAITSSEITKLRENYLGKSVFVNVGRITEAKNQLLLVKAFKELIKEYNNFKLLIIGENRDSGLYEQLVAEIADNNSIELLGGKLNIGDYLTIADGFCLTSIYEGMPISLIEAMSVGCIPICTPVGGIPDMIENSTTGFISKEVTVASYLEALMAYINAKDKDQLSKNCINIFNNLFHIKICAQQYATLYAKSY